MVCSNIFPPISKNFRDSEYFKDSSSWRMYPRQTREFTRRWVVLLWYPRLLLSSMIPMGPFSARVSITRKIFSAT